MKLMDDVLEYIDSANYINSDTRSRPISSNQLDFLSRGPNPSKARPSSSARRLPPIEAGSLLTKSTDSSVEVGSSAPSVTPRRNLASSSENFFKNTSSTEVTRRKPPVRLSSLELNSSGKNYISEDLPPAIQILNEFERQASEFKASAPNSSRYSFSGRPTSSSKDILVRKHSGRLKSLENLLDSHTTETHKMNHGKENKKQERGNYSASSNNLVPNTSHNKPEDALSVVSYAPSHQTEADISQLNGKRILLNDKPAQLPQPSQSNPSPAKKPIPKIPVKQNCVSKPIATKITRPTGPINRQNNSSNLNSNNNSAGARKYPLNTSHVADARKTNSMARPGFGSNGSINKAGMAAKNTNTTAEQASKKVEQVSAAPSNRVEETKTQPSLITSVEPSEISKPELNPSKIETSRIEKNKKLPQTKPSLPPQTPSSPPPSQTTEPSPVVVPKSQSATKSRPTDRLDMYSNHLAFYDNKPSSAVSLISMISSHPATNSQIGMKVIGEKTEPVVYQLFEDLPQPFSQVKQVDQPGSASKNSASKSKKPIKPKKSNVNLVRSKTVMNVSAKAKTDKSAKGVKKKNDKKQTKEDKANGGKSNENEYDAEEFEKEISSDSSSDTETQGSMGRRKSSKSSIVESMSKFKSEPDLLNKSAISTIELNDMPPSNDPKPTARIDIDFVKSFEDKLFAIYHKFDNLLTLQANKIASSSSEKDGDSVDNINKELSEQKAQFSTELERELIGSSNFEEMSSNPELVKRLKYIHDMIRQNIITTDEEPEIPSPQSSSLNSQISLAKKPPINNQNASHKSNKSNIREVYAQVNSLKTIKNEKDKDEWSSVTLNFQKTITQDPELKVHKIPTSLSEKINTIITPFMNASITIESDEVDDKKKMKFTPNPALDRFDVNMDSIGYDSNKSDSVDMDNGGSSGERLILSPIGDRSDFEKETKFPWKRGNLLGHGAFGNVYQALLINSGEIVAVKQIEMEETDPIKAQKEYESVKEEVRILRELEHINIVKFWDTQLDGNVVSIFMEYIPGGTIENLVKQYGTFEEKLVQNFTHQICNGISYIHSKNVVHRDIKGKNIMLMSSGIIKLIDFGCAKRLKMNQNSNSIRTLLKSLKGTPYWMAPEVIRETGHGPKADSWSLGATVYEMATGAPPWSHLNPYAALNAIANSNEPAPGLPLDKFTPEAIDFVNKCLTRDEKLRPSASELLNHKFLVGLKS